MSGNPLTAAQPRTSRSGAKASALFELTKAHLSLYISLSAVFGHLLAAGRPDRNSLLLGACVWLLSAGSAVANNIQDRTYDSYFARTRNRSLPRKRVGLLTAFCLSVLGIGAGLSGLCYFFDSHLPWIVGLAGVGCYNGLYTPLKKQTLWAYVPGVVCGMLPPAIGWTAFQGGAVDGSFQTLFLAMLMLGLWQVPHFLILDLKQSGQETPSGFPGFASRITVPGLRCQVAIWTCLYSLSVLLFLMRDGVSSFFLAGLTAANAVAVPVLIGLLIGAKDSRRHAGLGFGLLNLSVLGVMSAAILDRIIRYF